MNQFLQDQRQNELKKQIENNELLGLKDDKSEKLSTIKSDDGSVYVDTVNIDKMPMLTRKNLIKRIQSSSDEKDKENEKEKKKPERLKASDDIDTMAKKLNKINRLVKRHETQKSLGLNLRRKQTTIKKSVTK